MRMALTRISSSSLRPSPPDLCEREPFLDTEDGAAFPSVFKHIRLQYIINDLASARILERDNILPAGECCCGFTCHTMR